MELIVNLRIYVVELKEKAFSFAFNCKSITFSTWNLHSREFQLVLGHLQIKMQLADLHFG